MLKHGEQGKAKRNGRTKRYEKKFHSVLSILQTREKNISVEGKTRNSHRNLESTYAFRTNRFKWVPNLQYLPILMKAKSVPTYLTIWGCLFHYPRTLGLTVQDKLDKVKFKAGKLPKIKNSMKYTGMN